MSATYKSSHYESIERAHRAHFWFRARSLLLKKLVLRFIPQGQGKTFLEIGFGTGIVLELLDSLGFATTGIDVNAKAVTYAKKHTRAHLVQQSIFSYHPQKHFDAIGAFDVMEHIRDDPGFLKACWKLLNPGGFLFMTVPAGMWLWSEIDAASDHQRRYESGELRKLLTENGFEVEFLNFWQMVTLPFYIVWRQFARREKEPVGAYLELPPEPLHTLLYILLRLEQPFVMGMGLPVGGSLLVCAKKKSI